MLRFIEADRRKRKIDSTAALVGGPYFLVAGIGLVAVGYKK